MNEWATRIQTHPVWDRLKSVGDLLRSLELRAEDPTEASGDLLRIANVVDIVDARLRSMDPIALFPGPLGPMDGHLQSVVSELTSFQSNRNRAHLSNANTQLDALLAQAAQLGLSASPSTPEISRALDGVRLQMEQTLRSLMDRERALAAQLSALQEASAATAAEVTAQKARLDTAIAEYQTQFSSAEAARQQLATEALKNHTQRLDQAMSESQKRLQESELDISRRLESNLSDASAKASQQRDQLTEAAQGILERLADMKLKAENLLHVIGSTGMAGEYQKVADIAATTTRVWQGFAAIAMVGLIVFAVLTYTGTQDTDNIRWGSVAARAFVTLTFGLVAAYAARQGDRYADLEARNRRYQLELSSLDPYLANLPQETQHQVKVEIAQKLFGNASRGPDPRVKRFSGTGKEPLELALGILMELVRKQ